jgi:hypothetical protein
LVVTVVCSLAVVAEAQRRTPEAEALFDEGKALMKAGDPAGACRSFQASHNVDPRAATLMSIGACLEAQQKLCRSRFLGPPRRTRELPRCNTKELLS